MQNSLKRDLVLAGELEEWINKAYNEMLDEFPEDLEQYFKEKHKINWLPDLLEKVKLNFKSDYSRRALYFVKSHLENLRRLFTGEKAKNADVFKNVCCFIIALEKPCRIFYERYVEFKEYISVLVKDELKEIKNPEVRERIEYKIKKYEKDYKTKVENIFKHQPELAKSYFWAWEKLDKDIKVRPAILQDFVIACALLNALEKSQAEAFAEFSKDLENCLKEKERRQTENLEDIKRLPKLYDNVLCEPWVALLERMAKLITLEFSGFKLARKTRSFELGQALDFVLRVQHVKPHYDYLRKLKGAMAKYDPDCFKIFF